MIISPCISICKTDPVTGYCYGCGRNNEDKIMWKDEKTSDEWKKNNIEKLILLYPEILRSNTIGISLILILFFDE